MKSMTYGQLPTFAEFERAFNRVVPTTMYGTQHKFKISNDRRVGTYSFDVFELWQEVVEATSEWEHGSEAAGDWASSVLQVLGFEWI